MKLRRKLWLGFGGLLAILLVVAGIGIAVLEHHSSTMDRIFRENYDSVAAMEKVKDAIHELDATALFSVWKKGASDNSTQFREQVEHSLAFERTNITLLGEAELAGRLDQLWTKYKAERQKLFELPTADAEQHYIQTLQPLSQQVNATAQAIADVNLTNMVSVDGQVQQTARNARNAVMALLAAGAVFSIIYVTLFSASVLRPLETLSQSAREIGKGNLDLVVQSVSKDEVGQLAEEFNVMAASLREFRRSDRARLVRTQQTTQQAINTLHDAVAVLSVGGVIEIANDVARRRFGLEPDKNVDELKLGWLAGLHRHVCQSERPFEPRGYENAIQVFIDNEERFFLPHGLPMFGDGRRLVGVIVVLADVTQLRRLDEMKSGLVSTVSHELKTPLTSIRMAVHLLLEEKVGSLAPKQLELLIAARDDTDRLYRIIENLLDISRIESGRVRMDVTPMAPDKLATDAVEPLRSAFDSKGVALISDVPAGLPAVAVDSTRIGQVFSNLLNNALKYTPSGGAVRITGAVDGKRLRFSIRDSGRGIPAEFQGRIFEKFFRVPGQGAESGAGLGLAIAKDIVEAHGGTLSVESIEGSGSNFTFWLNVVDSE